MTQIQTKKSEKIKQTLQQAALYLANQKGFEKTSIREICTKAGVPVGAFFHYYANKDELLNESFLFFDHAITAQMIRHYDRMNPLDAIRAVLITQTAFVQSIGSNLMKEYYRALLQEQGTKAIADSRLYYRLVKKYVANAQQNYQLVSTISADTMSRFLIKSVRGCVIDWCLREGDYDVTHQMTQELEFYLQSFFTTSSQKETASPS